ncbi:MAG TPA: MBL fold metallo-hydrolase, partial [Acidilobales archaeon]|nr:MBL fold metallo-hydrolase [Acidilobales archaeon]
MLVVGLGSAYIYVLVDNYSREGFLSEWGLSLYIESNEWRALFDSGTSGEVLRYNTSRLGIDLTKLDFAFLSHHHGDHYGGFKYVGQVCPSLTVYIPPGGYGYLESWGLRPIVINEPQQISSSAWSTGPLRLCLWGLREHSLVFIIKGKGLVIVVGCSHPGLKVIIDRSINITGV